MRISTRDEQTGATPSPWDAAGRERPVFLDERGRRLRFLRPVGVLAVVLTAGWLAGLVLGATGFTTLAPPRPAVAARPAVTAPAPPPVTAAPPRATAREIRTRRTVTTAVDRT